MFVVLVAALLGVTILKTLPTVFAWQSITTLTTEEVNFFTPYTYYASTGYCTPDQTLTWDCGANCEANPTFKPVASGGNGDTVPYWYVGFDSDLNTVIVAHEGTDLSRVLVIITDTDCLQTRLDPVLFPGLSSDIEVHSGFAYAQAFSAPDILTAVQRTMSKFDTTSVTMVGHSLGGAITLLDSVYLPLHLPAGTSFRTISYGLPRVGNQAFADYVDANLHLTHINNKEDPIPVVPPRSLGFVHASGEIHIQDSGTWVACPGQDNPSKQCIVGDVPSALDGNVEDHYGPYNRIMMGC